MEAPKKRGRPSRGEAPPAISEKLAKDLLDAAEASFATHGFRETKIRSIAEAAGSNIGALYYYWKTKEDLFRAVCQRRLYPVIEERARRLDDALAKAKSKTPDMREVLRAVIEPVVRYSRADVAMGNQFGALFARTLTDSAPEVSRVVHEIVDESLFHCARILRKSCAHLDDQTFFWRLSFVFSAMQNGPAHRQNIERISYGRFDSRDLDAGSDELIAFLCAGLSAPPARSADRKSKPQQ